MKGEKMASKEKLNFEEAMKKLEEITAELEKNDLDLDTSVSKFEEGMKLSKECSNMLEEAEKRISVLIKKEEGVTEEDFE
jgi:exodeoxyribonuclease VII small subunit